MEVGVLDGYQVKKAVLSKIEPLFKVNELSNILRLLFDYLAQIEQ